MAIEHRWAILDALYRTKGMAPQSLYDNELETKLGVSWNRLRDDVDYLAQREFVSVTRSQRGSRIYTRLRLMAAGIDLIEGSTEDAAVPPPDALPDATSGPVTWTRSAIRAAPEGRVHR